MTSIPFGARWGRGRMTMAGVVVFGAALARSSSAGDDLVPRGAGLHEGSPASDSASGGVSARVMSGLRIQKTRDLEIGTVRAGLTGGSVTLSPDASRTTRGGVTSVALASDSASFRITAASNPERVKIGLPSRVILGRVGGEETVVARDFVGRLARCSGADCEGSTLALDVGLTLDIGPDQAPGRYVGAFTVTVNES